MERTFFGLKISQGMNRNRSAALQDFVRVIVIAIRVRRSLVAKQRQFVSLLLQKGNRTDKSSEESVGVNADFHFRGRFLYLGCICGQWIYLKVFPSVLDERV